MKRLLFLAAALSVCFVADAQKVTSGVVAPIFEQKILNVKFDFSQAVIDGVKEASLLNIGGDRAKDWKEGKEDICSKFLLALVPIVDNVLQVGYYEDAVYSFVFIPQSFDDDGEVNGFANIVGPEGEIIATVSKINGDGGRWGSFMNLCGDSMTRAGEQVGRFLMKEYVKMLRQQQVKK